MKFYIKVLSLSFFSILFIHFLHAQNYVNVVDKVGFTYQNPLVEQKATEAIQSTPITGGNSSFKVYSYSLYPIMGCIIGDCGLESAKEKALEDLDQRGYGIGIIKEFVSSNNPSGSEPIWKIKFTVKINLPKEDPLYNEVDEIERQALEKLVENSMAETYKLNFGFELGALVAKCEIMGLDVYRTNVISLRNGTNISNSMNLAGFEEIDITGFNFRQQRASGLKGGNGDRNEKDEIIEYKQTNSENWLLFGDCYRTDSIDVFGKSFKFYVYTDTDYVSNFDPKQMWDSINHHKADIGILFYFASPYNPGGTGHTAHEYNKLYYSIYNNINTNEANELSTQILESRIRQAFGVGNAVRGDLNNNDRQIVNNEWARWGYNALMSNPNTSTAEAIGYGVVDGFLGTFMSLYDMGSYAINEFSCESTQKDEEIRKVILSRIFLTSVDKGLTFEDFIDYKEKIANIYNFLIIEEGYKLLLPNIIDSIKETFDNELSLILSDSKEGYYETGKLLFEVIYEFGSTFASGGASFVKNVPKLLKSLKDAIVSNGKNFSAVIKGCLERVKSAQGIFPDPATAKKWFKCKILGKGCFVKDTPILMAGTANQFSLRHSVPAYAMAALPLISPVPIQEVQLLDYAVAHKSVNSSYVLTANASDTYVIGKDPYTSDEQRVRDQYEINDTDWHEVSFKEVNGLSSCKLALQQDWIESHDYMVDGIVNMNLPEQGISGPFKITSIRRIQPQKIPVDEDPDDDYEYRPVTGLFTHQSDDVYTIGFTTHPTLGVTATHPIYSTTYHDWRLAGELEVGERVLTYQGEATVSSTEKRAGSETVYNLEVKDLHNFLVGDAGVVVHNACAKSYFGDKYDGYLRDLKSTGMSHSEAVEELEKIAKAAEDKLIELGEPLSKGITDQIRQAAKDFTDKMKDELKNQLSNTATDAISEVTFDVVLYNGSSYEIRVDGVVDNVNGGIEMGEAKYTTDDSKDWTNKFRQTMTDHQKMFLDDRIAGDVKEIVPKGPNSKLGRVGLSKGVPVPVANIKSYRIFGSNKNKVKVWQKILF